MGARHDLTSSDVAATIGIVDVTALIVAAIGITAGFIGGFLSARWQARNDLAQWHRDRLLQFCADFLAAGDKIVDAARDAMLRGERPVDIAEAQTSLSHALACIFLLCPETLGSSSTAYFSAVYGLLEEEHITRGKPGAPSASGRDAYADARTEFTWKAHEELYGK